MLQVPSLPAYQYPQPSYNAVKIDIHNPSVGGATCPVQPVQPQMMPQPQYTAPMYTYPQAPVYTYPQAPQQPYYMPMPQNDALTQAQAAQAATQAQAQAVAQAQAQAVAQAQAQAQAVAQAQAQTQAQTQMQCPPCAAPTVVPAAAAATAAAATAATVPVQQVNINQAPKAPQPVVTTQAPVAAETPKVEVQAPVEIQPQVDLNGFIARLTNPDFEVQANTMEEIANMVKEEPQKATELLDAKIIDALINITNADSSKLAGPTQEQIAARQKLISGQQISDADKNLATTITPMEQAERNKSYALYTTAILEKLYKEEVAKLTGATVPLTELPAAMTVVDHLKDNPNPMVRASAIEAMSYIQAPEYKKDLNTIFSVALNDQDKGVQEAAKAALNKLEQV